MNEKMSISKTDITKTDISKLISKKVRILFLSVKASYTVKSIQEAYTDKMGN